MGLVLKKLAFKLSWCDYFKYEHSYRNTNFKFHERRVINDQQVCAFRYELYRLERYTHHKLCILHLIKN